MVNGIVVLMSLEGNLPKEAIPYPVFIYIYVCESILVCTYCSLTSVFKLKVKGWSQLPPLAKLSSHVSQFKFN